MRILLVDDDESLTELLAANLSKQHYVVDVAFDGETGWEYSVASEYDLIVLDVMLPKLDGVSFCRQLRDRGYQKPILLLTARSTRADKVMGLDSGADDYVVKPFDVEELTARIRALLRREGTSRSPLLVWGSLSLNLNTCEVCYQQQLLHLTPKEYGILELFLRHPAQVFSPAAILESLWTLADSPGEDTVRSHIKGLRRKLKAAGAAADLIETVYGLGYRLQALSDESSQSQEGQTKEGQAKEGQAKEGQAKESQAKEGQAKGHQIKDNRAEDTMLPPRSTPKPAPNAETLASVNRAWTKFKDKMVQRVEVLEQAAIALREGRLNGELQQQARAAAHKLAGSLGSFGRARGSQLAQELETLWQAEALLEQSQAQQVGELTVALRCELGKPASWDAPPPTGDPSPLLLLIGERSAFTQQLIAEATDWGMRTAISPNLSSARESAQQERPDAVLLQLSFSRADAIDRISSAAGLALTREIASQTPPIPVLVVAEGGSFATRIEVVRQLGVVTFLQKPRTPSPVLDAVTRLIRRARLEAKVMIVDDEPQMLKQLHAMLSSWSFKLTVLDDPRRFWDCLETVNPDLLLLDVDMPYANGLELCQIIRSDWRWSRLPVLLLTDRIEVDILEQAFRIGADDCIRKSVVGMELANRILSRLERMQPGAEAAHHG